MKHLPHIWASALIASSIALALFSFFIINDIVDGVLIYIAQCLLFAGSVAGLPRIFDLYNFMKDHERNKKDT